MGVAGGTAGRAGGWERGGGGGGGRGRGKREAVKSLRIVQVRFSFCDMEI